jgi:hypothetical protein
MERIICEKAQNNCTHLATMLHQTEQNIHIFCGSFVVILDSTKKHQSSAVKSTSITPSTKISWQQCRYYQTSEWHKMVRTKAKLSVWGLEHLNVNTQNRITESTTSVISY